jgi:hypothetical protein
VNFLLQIGHSRSTLRLVLASFALAVSSASRHFAKQITRLSFQRLGDGWLRCAPLRLKPLSEPPGYKKLATQGRTPLVLTPPGANLLPLNCGQAIQSRIKILGYFKLRPSSF